MWVKLSAAVFSKIFVRSLLWKLLFHAVLTLLAVFRFILCPLKSVPSLPMRVENNLGITRFLMIFVPWNDRVGEMANIMSAITIVGVRMRDEEDCYG